MKTEDGGEEADWAIYFSRALLNTFFFVSDSPRSRPCSTRWRRSNPTLCQNGPFSFEYDWAKTQGKIVIEYVGKMLGYPVLFESFVTPDDVRG
jgi:hypothetical protein